MATADARNNRGVLRWFIGIVAVLLTVGLPAATASADVQFLKDTVTLGTDGAATVTVVNASDAQQTIRLRWTATHIRVVGDATEVVEASRLFEPGEVWSITLQKTTSDRSPFTVIASSTDGTAARLAVTPASLQSWWSSWFDDALAPLAIALGEAAFLLVVASFLASSIADLVTRYRSAYERPPLRPRGMNVVGYALVVFGGARLLFNAGRWPAQGGTVEHWLATGHRGLTWSIVGVAAVLLAVTIVRRLVPAGTTVYGRRRRDSTTWYLADATIVAAAAVVVGWPAAGSIRTSVIGVVLLLLGIALVTWHAVWNPELTVESAGADDAAGVVARLPEALEKLSGQGEVRVRMAASVPSAAAVADSLSALPTSPWAKVAVSLAKAVTPNAGFRLSVRSEKVDELVTVRAVIRRGRREVATQVIACSELHPTANDDTPDGHDGPAEAAIALASWLTHRWVELSGENRPASFYGTTGWLAHALVHVAEEHQDAGRFHEADLLLSRAVATDPHSWQAHFSRLSVRVAVLDWPRPGTTVTASAATAPAMATARTELQRDLDELVRVLQREYPASALHQQALYLLMAVHHYATDQPGHEGAAQRAATNLMRIFELYDAFEHRLLWLFDRRALLAAAGARLSEACRETTAEALDLDVRYPFGTERALGAAMMARLRPLHEVITAPDDRASFDDDARRQYNRACALAADPVTNREAIERNLRAAMVLPRLACWALRDPSLNHLWTPAVTSMQVPPVTGASTDHVAWFDVYLNRLDDLGREAPDLAPFVTAGMKAALAARVRYQTDIRTLRDLANQTTQGNEPELARRVGADAAKELVATHDVWAMAADPGIGAAWARMLRRAGCDRTTALAAAHPETVRARVTAAVAADPKTKLTAPSKQLAEGWVHACIAMQPTTTTVDVHRASYVEWERCTVVQR